jgi:hypothetical protein
MLPCPNVSEMTTGRGKNCDESSAETKKLVQKKKLTDLVGGWAEMLEPVVCDVFSHNTTVTLEF